MASVVDIEIVIGFMSTLLHLTSISGFGFEIHFFTTNVYQKEKIEYIPMNHTSYYHIWHTITENFFHQSGLRDLKIV